MKEILSFTNLLFLYQERLQLHNLIDKINTGEKADDAEIAFLRQFNCKLTQPHYINIDEENMDITVYTDTLRLMKIIDEKMPEIQEHLPLIWIMVTRGIF